MCERCGYYGSLGARYCPVCGSPIPRRERNSDLKNIVLVMGCAVSVLVIIGLLFEIIVGLGKAGFVIDNLNGYTDHLFIIIPSILDLFTVSGDMLIVYYILLLAAVTVSILTLVYVTAGRYGSKKDIADTPLYEMAVLFGALYFVQIVMIIFLNAIGVDTDTPGDRPVWQWMFELLQASVWEEVITRFLYLGLPVTIVYYMMRKEGRSPRWLLGGFGIDKVSLIFIVFSAFMFGAGHLSGWGVWKFAPTFLFGLITGYLYCKYGIYVTICFHFLTDYAQAGMWLTGSDSFVLTSLALITIAFLSIPFVWVYLKRGYRCLEDQLNN